MRKSYYLIAFLFGIVISCSKDDLIEDNQEISQLRTSEVIVEVYPGSNDTQAIIDAFQIASLAGRGATVRLMPGVYRIGMIEVKEFYGTLEGSGKEETIVTNLSDLTNEKVKSLNKLPALITFIGGDVTVSDLTIRMTDALPWMGIDEMNLILFSDYSADFIPADKHIRLNLNDINAEGIMGSDISLWPGGPVIDLPLFKFNGVKVAPDILTIGTERIYRCHADANVNSCSFTTFSKGICIWGCMEGNLRIGTESGNTFNENDQSLVINENSGMNAIIENNEFNIPDYFLNGLEIKIGGLLFKEIFLEYIFGRLGSFEIRNNVFNIKNSTGIEAGDAWRYWYPENPMWLDIKCENNTFNMLNEGAALALNFNLKNCIFQKNIIKGDQVGGYMLNSGLYWIDSSDPNFLFSWSEGCKFMNNQILQSCFFYVMDWDTKNYIIQVNQANLAIADYGVNNKLVGKADPYTTYDGTIKERNLNIHTERMLNKAIFRSYDRYKDFVHVSTSLW